MFRFVPKIKNRDRKQRDSTDDVNDLHLQSQSQSQSQSQTQTHLSSPPRIIESPQKDIPIPAQSVAAAPTAFYLVSTIDLIGRFDAIHLSIGYKT